jgi:hypothetical protein
MAQQHWLWFADNGVKEDQKDRILDEYRILIKEITDKSIYIYIIHVYYVFPKHNGTE